MKAKDKVKINLTILKSVNFESLCKEEIDYIKQEPERIYTISHLNDSKSHNIVFENDEVLMFTAFDETELILIKGN
ncbi:hypothetical protein [Gottfriedia solisilvae]|uniref:hypothetical protein n=1 Tax=Gottfriedia solisilvae TaxID=1516104 RepID=UPI003D2ED187